MAQQLTVTLSDDLAARLRERIAAGHFADESAAVAEGLRVLEEDAGFEAWLREEVNPALAEADRDPASVRTSAEVRASLGLGPAVHDERRVYDPGL